MNTAIPQSLPEGFYQQADVCLLLEGTYPYVRGGVSSWTDDLIRSQPDKTFHVVCLLPGTTQPKILYPIADNVVSVSNIYLAHLPHTGKPARGNLMAELQPFLSRIVHNKAGKSDFHSLIDLLNPYRDRLGAAYLLNSRDAWDALVQMYESRYHESSMLDYFWSWRALLGGIFSVLLAPLPKADLYHTVCTGYAGLLAARARIEQQKPALLTEHGIYTSERRIEIASANWLEQTASSQLTIDTLRNDLRDLWIDSFNNYSRICYDCMDRIVTLYAGNQITQRADGADPKKMQIIPNGVDVERFNNIIPKDHDVPTIAMIGRVVPIKDVKSFIRAVALIKEALGDVQALILGNTDEDPEYVMECREIVKHLGLNNNIEFTGAVRIDDYLPVIDVVVFTSISEAQPLVILEVGAAGIPVVTTNVGACDDMVNGAPDEFPRFGAGGEVVPLANPTAVAQATLRLLADSAHYQQCAYNIRQRVSAHYTKEQQRAAYSALYDELIHNEL